MHVPGLNHGVEITAGTEVEIEVSFGGCLIIESVAWGFVGIGIVSHAEGKADGVGTLVGTAESGV